MTEKNNNWWEKTFNETYFSFWNPSDLKSQSWTKKELKLIDGLSLKNGAKILDIPCGQGRHSVELAKKGFQVTGVDYSLSALKTAKEWADKNKVYPNFVRQDIRFLKMKEKFDMVLTMGNSFGYFPDDENKKLIKNISKLLKPNGFFVLQQINPVEALRQFGKKDRFKIPGGYVETKDIDFNPSTFVKDSRWVVIRGNKKEILNVRLRLYTFPEIFSLFSDYNLKIIKSYGSFNKKNISV